jgi:hypothetical protein
VLTSLPSTQPAARRTGIIQQEGRQSERNETHKRRRRRRRRREEIGRKLEVCCVVEQIK